jgi:hypothetical protein
METLKMSRKERNRLTIMAGLKSGKLRLVQAAGLASLSYRQMKRVWRRYQDEGDAGLVHRLRGQASARRIAPELRARILARVEARYPDFGPTLAAEYLGKEGLKVDHETLRRWLLAEGRRVVGRRRQKHRQWRERKPCFGAMVQLDGSDHDWFEGRRERAVLMVMVDDATGHVWAQFFEQETTPEPATTCSRAGCAAGACPRVCMWIGTASTAVKVWAALPINWLVKSRKRSLAGRWSSWEWN